LIINQRNKNREISRARKVNEYDGLIRFKFIKGDK
jgi:hypothetical protein